ncbi:MAG TPA: hypothetical protein PLH19_09845 [Anaerolineae bacterium]|nr:hypothetical protein [Anaerolineae bacterium]HQH38819.1 hypothetical protein [Anaerolineae bacterium]
MQLRQSYFKGWLRAIFVLNVALALSSFGLWGLALRQGLYWRADFTMLYTGGMLVREGHGTQLYDLEVQTQYQQQILSGKSFRDGVLPFNYPPYVGTVDGAVYFDAPLSGLCCMDCVSRGTAILAYASVVATHCRVGIPRTMAVFSHYLCFYTSAFHFSVGQFLFTFVGFLDGMLCTSEV